MIYIVCVSQRLLIIHEWLCVMGFVTSFLCKNKGTLGFVQATGEKKTAMYV
jgi:hypothetical protein